MYHIGTERPGARTLRDSLAAAAKRPIERLRHPGAATHTSEQLWALRDVEMEVGRSEVLGIIGRNGAGKSTLLKILSRITEPTEGRVEVRGLVASLLEVGTGFHPELTGRENIRLNGAILGMRNAEIRSKFDEIVEFSEIGRFLDTPVKRYSSGMYIRLAFAVAAHLDPEILVIDEVLAVGDFAFQKKCLGKMGDVATSGRTVLFVSHNMPAVRGLCTRVIELTAGRVTNQGDPDEVVDAYLKSNTDAGSGGEWKPQGGLGDDRARLVAVRVCDAGGNPCDQFSTREPIVVEMDVDLVEPPEDLCIGFELVSANGAIVWRTFQTDVAVEEWPQLASGRNRLSCEIPALILNSGRYLIVPRMSIHTVRWILNADSGLPFDVQADHSASPFSWTGRPGVLAPVLQWSAQVLHGVGLS
jgi:lipopolysaccharide transport system ATP-binding protein